MIGRLWFYRRRRVLPFMAVFCLVFINGATLVPFAPPALHPEVFPARPSEANRGARNDSWRRARYERDHDGAEPESVVAAGMPPIVKNLRRPAPSRHFKAVVSGGGLHPADDRGPTVGSEQRAPAGNAADLNRLCRLLL